MDTNLYDVTCRIFTSVTFIAIGGTVAVVFFFVFAQSILGARHVEKHLNALEKKLDRTNELLEKFCEQQARPDAKD